MALVVQVPPAGLEVTVYPVTAEPPFHPGAVQDTFAAPAAAVAAGADGGSGVTPIDHLRAR